MNDLFLSVGIELIVAPHRQLDALVRRILDQTLTAGSFGLDSIGL